MTTIYEWFGWPNTVEIVCPTCGKKSDFIGSEQIVKKHYNQGQRATRIFTNKRHGKISCLSCGMVKEITIEWPQDAFYKVMVRGKVLWAWNKEHAISIRDYLASTRRNRHQHKYCASLYHIPEIFTLAKNRVKCVDGLTKTISKV